MGKNSEYEQIGFVEQWLKDYFPNIIDRSQYHRRVKLLWRTINDVRVKVLNEIMLKLSDIHIIDSTPIPVIKFQRAHYTPLFSEAEFGYCVARKMTYYGFKLHLVVDKQGIPIHFDLTPANIHDGDMTEQLLAFSSQNRLVLADKGYLSKNTQSKLQQLYDTILFTPKRKNQKDREPRQERKLLNKWRQKIEIINGLLKDKFNFERTYAKSLDGLISRIMCKITAFTFGIFLNKLFDRKMLSVSTLVR
jgi:transposase